MIRMVSVLILLLGCQGRVFSQLASDPKADDLLIDALLTLDELSLSYCARFQGMYTGITRDGVPRAMQIYGLASEEFAQKAGFHSWGSFHVEGQVSSDIMWMDALRVGEEKKLFKISSNRGTEFAKGIEAEQSRDESSDDAKKMWSWPELDPFGLVFGIESSLQRRNSKFTHVRDQLSQFSLINSSVAANSQNVVGQWMSRTKSSILTVEFDRKKNNVPIIVRFQLRDSKTGELVRTIGFTRTDWQAYGSTSMFVPRKTTITSERASGEETEIELNWEWIDPTRWQGASIDFEELSKPHVSNWREVFIDLFESQRDRVEEIEGR